MKEKNKSPYKDVNGQPIYEGNIVKGIGKYVGQSEVFFKHGQWQPFSYLNDYDGKNYIIVRDSKDLGDRQYLKKL